MNLPWETVAHLEYLRTKHRLDPVRLLEDPDYRCGASAMLTDEQYHPSSPESVRAHAELASWCLVQMVLYVAVVNIAVLVSES